MTTISDQQLETLTCGLNTPYPPVPINEIYDALEGYDLGTCIICGQPATKLSYAFHFNHGRVELIHHKLNSQDDKLIERYCDSCARRQSA